jgi:hypothetical protein
MTTPKRHHFLPEFYQHGFTTGGYLWLFDRETGRYRREQPVNTAVIGHYYSVESDDGTKDPRVERFLANTIESDAKPVIAKLDAGDQITEDEKDALAYFAAFLHFRVPRFQRYLDEMIDGTAKALMPLLTHSPDDLKEALSNTPGLTAEQRDIPPELLYDFMMAGEYRVKATREFRVHMMLSLAGEIQNYFRQMEWAVARAPRGTGFLTTDAPLIIIPPMDRLADAQSAPGFITPGAKKVLPLTARTVLIMGDRGDQVLYREMPKDIVRQTNIFVVRESERFVIGRDEAHVRSLVAKTQLDRRKNEPLVQLA